MKRFLYRVLKYSNDVRAVQRAVTSKSSRPVTRRVGRRVYGKLAGALARKMFG